MRRLDPDEYARRLFARVEEGADGGCWVWTGTRTQSGYGLAYSPAHRGSRPAHRVVYELLVAPIPPGFDLDHLCRVRACVNPEHLEPVTRQENLRRSVDAIGPFGKARLNAAKTHCKRGHAFDEVNTYVTAAGGRSCRACNSERRSKVAA